jgi:tetratricopeptide (TPR) repeat protein
MATEPNNEHIFFVDDELVERLMRGDPVQPSQKTRPAETNALAKAVKLAQEGKLSEAAAVLEEAARQNGNPVEIYSALGHIRFEQEKWEEATDCYIRVAEADDKHRTAFYNLGLCLERRDMLDEAAEAFENAVAIDAEAGACGTWTMSPTSRQA